MTETLFNSVLPCKIYGIYKGNQKLWQVQAKDVHEAFRLGREKFPDATCAILNSKDRALPMFIE